MRFVYSTFGKVLVSLSLSLSECVFGPSLSLSQSARTWKNINGLVSQKSEPLVYSVCSHINLKTKSKFRKQEF